MNAWLETRTLEYPPGVVSGRFGASVMFVAYDKLLQRWLWLQPKGVVERIEEPPQIFVDTQWAQAHTLAKPRTPACEQKNLLRRKRSGQLLLEL